MGKESELILHHHQILKILFHRHHIALGRHLHHANRHEKQKGPSISPDQLCSNLMTLMLVMSLSVVVNKQALCTQLLTTKTDLVEQELVIDTEKVSEDLNPLQ